MRFYDFIQENIKKELLNRDMVFDDRFPVILDTEENDVAYFPLYNLSGKFIGYQRYNPKGSRKSFGKDGKYYTYVSSEGKGNYIAVYGLHTLDKRNYFFVVEGIFDAVKLIRINEPVIAVLGNDPKKLRPWFKAMGKTTISIVDNDKAGKLLGNNTDISYTTPDPYNDLGEMPLSKVEKFIKKIIRRK